MGKTVSRELPMLWSKEYASAAISYRVRCCVTNYLEGKLGEILTIADASFQDQEQRKACKDLIRRAFSDMWDFEDRSDVKAIISSISTFLRPLETDISGEEYAVYQKYISERITGALDEGMSDLLKKVKLG